MGAPRTNFPWCSGTIKLIFLNPHKNWLLVWWPIVFSENAWKMSPLTPNLLTMCLWHSSPWEIKSLFPLWIWDGKSDAMSFPRPGHKIENFHLTSLRHLLWEISLLIMRNSVTWRGHLEIFSWHSIWGQLVNHEFSQLSSQKLWSRNKLCPLWLFFWIPNLQNPWT